MLPHFSSAPFGAPTLCTFRAPFTYYKGQGVLKDTVTAYAWFNVAVANGAKNGSNSREMVAKEMTPEQIAKAQELSKVWFEEYQPKE